MHGCSDSGAAFEAKVGAAADGDVAGNGSDGGDLKVRSMLFCTKTVIFKRLSNGNKNINLSKTSY